MPADAQTRLRVYDVAGQHLRTLVDDVRTAGRDYEESWNGRDQTGRLAPAGVYFYRLEAGDFVEMKRMVLLK